MSNSLWVEKYRPDTLEGYVGNDHILEKVKIYIENDDVPHLLLYGVAGTGKTTLAKIITNQIDCDVMYINASDENSVDAVRDKIRGFASSMGFRKWKVVILDEADYLNPQSTQPALRGFIEEFSNNCRFIMTCNFKNRIIEPLHSRCGVYEFNTSKKEMASLCGDFFKHARNILEQENVKFEDQDLVKIIMKHAPDWRRVLNEVQRRSVGGVLSNSGSNSTGINEIDALLKFIKDKDFKKMRSWVVNNIDTDSSAIFRGIYDKMSNHIKPHAIPQVVLILAEYQYKNAFVADLEINTVACLTEIMANVEFIE